MTAHTSNDCFTRRKRSEVMSRVRSRGNRTTELVLVRMLREARVTGWRRHVALPGTPDFCFRAQRIAIFIDGCFWHSCARHGSIPLTNRAYWRAKLARNVERDRKYTAALRGKGWLVVRIWGHELKPKGGIPARLRRVFSAHHLST